MAGFLEAAVFIAFYASQVNKINTIAQSINHAGEVVLRIRPIGTGTKCESVVWGFHGFKQLTGVVFGADNTGKPEQRKGRVVRVNSHPDAVFFSDGYNFLQEIMEV